MEKSYRLEKDSLGEVKIPQDKIWGPQTQRSLENFKIGEQIMPKDLIKSILVLKMACAYANEKSHKLDKNKANLIIKATQQLLTTNYMVHFPLKIWQTGSGTQTNMNINEVIAHLVSKKNNPIHPNDHVNMSQSSNDIFPSAMHLCLYEMFNKKLLPAMEHLLKALSNKEKEFAQVIKIGRTHMQDATPIKLSTEINSWWEVINQSLNDLRCSAEALYNSLPIGGSAVGNGINVPANFATFVYQYLDGFYHTKHKNILKNKCGGLAFKYEVSKFHSCLRNLSLLLNKIANDVRFYSCGPRAGIGELLLPANEPGSSIMPGKVNPTQCEALIMVCQQVMGFDVAIANACSCGHQQLNTLMPLIIYDATQSVELLADAINSFVNNCLVGITINQQKIKENLESSLMLATALTPEIGYQKAAEVVKYAHKNNISLRESIVLLNIMSAKEFTAIIKKLFSQIK